MALIWRRDVNKSGHHKCAVSLQHSLQRYYFFSAIGVPLSSLKIEKSILVNPDGSLSNPNLVKHREVISEVELPKMGKAGLATHLSWQFLSHAGSDPGAVLSH